jgi:hypothetical protein
MTEVYAPLPAGFTRPTDLMAPSYEMVAVSLVDLIRARLIQRTTAIRNVNFTNCRIEGPAVILVLGCHFERTDFGHPSGDIRSLVLRPASPDLVVGAIPVQDCTFTGCQFVGVGYTGADSFLDQILALGAPQ